MWSTDLSFAARSKALRSPGGLMLCRSASLKSTTISWAMTKAIWVLPRPGPPTSKAWSNFLLSAKAASTATRTCSTTAFCPTMWFKLVGVTSLISFAWSDIACSSHHEHQVAEGNRVQLADSPGIQIQLSCSVVGQLWVDGVGGTECFTGHGQERQTFCLACPDLLALIESLLVCRENLRVCHLPVRRTGVLQHSITSATACFSASCEAQKSPPCQTHLPVSASSCCGLVTA